MSDLTEAALLYELRRIVHVADEVDVTDWQRGYRALAELVARWVEARIAEPRPVVRLMVLENPAAIIDYRDLLIKYIEHVAAEEGTTYLVEWKRPDRRFSDEEWAELGRLADALPEPKPLIVVSEPDPARGEVWADGSPAI